MKPEKWRFHRVRPRADIKQGAVTRDCLPKLSRTRGADVVVVETELQHRRGVA